MLYTVNGLQHKQQNFCSAFVGGGASGWSLGARPGFSSVDVQDAVDQFFTKLADFYNAAWAGYDGWLLQVRSGTVWNYLSSGVTTVTPIGTDTYQVANGLTLSGKDTNQKNMPACLYEGSFGGPQKTKTPAALSVPARTLMNYFFNADGGAADEDAYNWRVSRGFAEADRLIVFVSDTNEKLREIRGIK